MNTITLTGLGTTYGWARNTSHHVSRTPSGIADGYSRSVLGGATNVFEFKQVGEFYLPEGELGSSPVPVVLFEGDPCIALKDFAIPVIQAGRIWERDHSRMVRNEFGTYSANVHFPALGASFALSDEEI